MVNLIISLGRSTLFILFIMLYPNYCICQKSKVANYVDSTINYIQDNFDEGSIPKIDSLLNWVMNKSNDRGTSVLDRSYLDKSIYRIIELKNYVDYESKLDSVRLLEQRINELGNEITAIQNSLIEIINNKKIDKNTKKYAIDVIVKIQNDEVMKFLFENEEDLRYGKLDLYTQDLEETRSTMKAIYDEYFNDKRKWALIPYISKYSQDGKYEYLMIREYIRDENNKSSVKHLLLYMKSLGNPIVSNIIEKHFSKEIE